MSESKHTPGPWTATPIGQGTGDYCIHARGIPWQLAYLAENSQVEWPIESNARLIAAAPEILAELKRMVEHFGTWAKDRSDEASTETWAALHCAEAVISKAEGRS